MRIPSLIKITKSVSTVIGVLLLAQARAEDNADGVSPYGDSFAPDVVSVDINGNGIYPDFEGDGIPFLDDYNNSSNVVDPAPDLSRRAAGDFYLRLMPLGASITQGQQSSDANGYRKWIRSQLRYKGWKVNMVGSKQDGDMADSDNEGHPGFTIGSVNSSWDNSKWMKPNLILLNVGLNDCSAGTSVDASKTAYKSLLDNIYRSDPGVTVVVSTLLLNTNTTLLPCLSALSQEIVNLVNDYSGSRIVLADIRSAMSFSDLGPDGTHPNDQGYKLFAGVWWSAISKIESIIQPPDANAGIDDAKEGGGNTCRKVAGNAGAPVQVQLGSGHDDGNYVHSSTAHGALSTAQINKNSDPKSITDAIPWHMFFANLVVGDPNADRKAALDDWIRVFHDTSGKNTYWFRQNLGGGKFGESKTFDVDMDCDLGPHYAFADFNNDGFDDFFCLKQNSVWVSINQKGNPPTFKSIGQIVGNLNGYGAEDVRIADIDGDGRADFCLVKDDGIVICSRNGGTSDTPQWQGFSTATGIRGTVFDKTTNAKSGIILADLNGDFKADYMFVNDFGNVHTWINNRGWNKGIVPDWRDAGLTHQGQSDTGIQGNIKFGRIYGSGRADYIYLKEQDDHYDVLVWENKGSGGTKRKADGNFYCDMFGTGSDDYVWIYMDGHSDEVDINVHEPPIWGHSVKLTLSVPGPRIGIHLADWTGNGRCDVLVQNKATGALTLHENHYDADAQTLTFGSGQQVTSGTCSEGWGVGIFDRGMRLADIDGDGRADPLCIEKDGRITAWLNKASGLINVNQIKFSEGWDRANIRFADVEASGRADLLHLDKYTGAVTVFKNNGQRTAGSSSFSWTNRGVLYSPIDRGETMHFLNLGGRGRADLLHVLPLTNRAWVYYNRCGTSGGDDGLITDPGLPVPPNNGDGSGPITVTTGGATITIPPIQTSNVQTLTEPDGSTTVLTLPPGSTITGVETITTGGSTITVGPVTTPLPNGVVTSTMTTVPPGVSLEDFTASRISTNIWITTTGSDSSTTIVPVILPCITCEPVIVWDTPEIPNVEFDWPSLPKLPTFHLPCIKIFGIRISGECPSPSGPPPVNDGPPREPEPYHEPNPDDPDNPDAPDPDSPAQNPCELQTDTGMCSNGEYPVFDTSTGTISCGAGSGNIGTCQKNIDDNLDAIKSYLENERSCCPPSSKAKRREHGGLLSSLVHRGLDTLGLSIDKRAVDFCPAVGQDPRQLTTTTGQCLATYTCPHDLFPNGTKNMSRGNGRFSQKPLEFILFKTPMYNGHFFSKSSSPVKAGWKLHDCQVEEYPFGSGNPDRSDNAQAVLRLIPGGGFRQHLENQEHGIQLKNWIQSVATRYNANQLQQTGTNPKINTNGIVYCVDFDPSFTAYLPEDLVDQNYCARAYGPEFTLVNHQKQGNQRTWDPWFDVPGTNRKSLELMHYINPAGEIVNVNPSDEDYAVYDVLPPTYCPNPSPGAHTFDANTNSWILKAGFQAVGRNDAIASNERCTDPPGVNNKRELLNMTAVEVVNATREHPRDMSVKRATGGFLDPNVYIFMGCLDGGDDDDDGDGVDPCDADDNPCGNEATNVPTTNGADPTEDPLPPSSLGGHSTGPVTATRTGGGQPQTTSFISCEHHNADPGDGVNSGYCVCSGSTVAESTYTQTTPFNSCGYTTMPTVTIPSQGPPKTTNTDQCKVCSTVGSNNQACEDLPNCTPKTTTTTSPTALPTPGNSGWYVGFYNNQCNDRVDPGLLQGQGLRDCAPVDDADCMNGSSNQFGDTWLCGYATTDCTAEDQDHIAELGPMGFGDGHSIIYADGEILPIKSWRIMQNGCS